MNDPERPAAVRQFATTPAPVLEDLVDFEFEQPLVFFREGWDFRWMSGAQVLGRIGLAESKRTIVDERGDFDEPAELVDFLQLLLALFEGQVHASASTPPVEDLGAVLSQGVKSRRRPSVVLPTADRDHSQFVLRLGLELGAAFILPPDPSTFVWTVCSCRPSMVAASDEGLIQLAADLETRPRWRRRRTMSATRHVLALGEATEEHDGLQALGSLMPGKAIMHRIVLAARASKRGGR